MEIVTGNGTPTLLGLPCFGRSDGPHRAEGAADAA